MLGLKSIKTTQHYVKIVDRKISDDMQLLKSKFAEGKARLSVAKSNHN